MSYSGFINEMRDLWRNILRMLTGSYHPERHYMRGTGPKCQARWPAHDRADMQLIRVHTRTRRRAR